jgi:hypothetical protein
MNKKILALASISAALFLSCSADDFFRPGDNPDPPPGTGSCNIIMGFCLDGVTQSECENFIVPGTFALGKSCPDSGGNDFF